MSDWNKIYLREIITIKNGFAFKSKDFVEHGIPVIKIKNVKPNRIIFDTLSYVDEKKVESLSKYLIMPGDILITMSGNRLDGSPDSWVGKVATFKHSGLYFLNQRVSILNVNKDLADEKFISFYLSSWEMQQHFINQSNSSGGQANISPSIVGNTEILLPPLKEQQAIAEVLSSLDDKINLLHRQNQTLEQMAETLFRKWFVEEAKEEWEHKSLSSIANFLNGLACQKFPPKNEIDKLPVLKIKELKDGFTDNSDWASTDIDQKYFVKNGDVIFSWSASLVVKIWDGDECILNQHLFKVSSDVFPKWFYYLWSKYHLQQFIAIASAHATTMGHIKRGDLDEAMVSVPSKSELDFMSETFQPILEKIILKNKQIKTLVNQRDNLLPKLMSGEVRVKTT